jgi:membrane protease YdiL (CAAX protease family)
MIDRILKRRSVSGLISYLKNPEVLEPQGVFNKRSLLGIAELGIILLAIQFVVILPLLYFWQQAFSIPDPNIVESKNLKIFLLAGFFLPIGEEIIFRGWMNGKPRNLWLAFCVVGLGTTSYLITKYLFENPLDSYEYADSLPLYNKLSWVFAAVAGWFLVRNKEAGANYRIHFPKIFYLTAIVFGLMHVTNYPNPGLVLLPMIIPQIWSGCIFGYARQKYGLMASMILHMTTNSLLLTTVFLQI